MKQPKHIESPLKIDLIDEAIPPHLRCFEELARRMAVAYTSYHLGENMQSTARRIGRPGLLWYAIAAEVSKAVAASQVTSHRM